MGTSTSPAVSRQIFSLPNGAQYGGITDISVSCRPGALDETDQHVITAVLSLRIAYRPARTCTTIAPQLSTLSVGTINVQRDAPIGTVIFPARRVMPAPTLAGVPIRLCWSFGMRYNNAALSSYGNHVYNTNVSGLAFGFHQMPILIA